MIRGALPPPPARAAPAMTGVSRGRFAGDSVSTRSCSVLMLATKVGAEAAAGRAFLAAGRLVAAFRGVDATRPCV